MATALKAAPYLSKTLYVCVQLNTIQKFMILSPGSGKVKISGTREIEHTLSILKQAKFGINSCNFRMNNILILMPIHKRMVGLETDSL